MVRFYRGLLVSSERNRERQCSSELFYVLTEHLGISGEEIFVQPTGVSGLITFKLASLDPISVSLQLKNFLGTKEENYLIETKRVVPIQEVVKTDIETISKTALELFGEKRGTWRISIRKRHHTIDRAALIDSIASKIDQPVNLETFDWDIRIEIIGPRTGISVLPPRADIRPLSSNSRS